MVLDNSFGVDVEVNSQHLEYSFLRYMKHLYYCFLDCYLMFLFSVGNGYFSLYDYFSRILFDLSMGLLINVAVGGIAILA